MKYFIDFEATQFSQEIIEVGCVREDGETFHSLIRPKNLKKITKFIEELTGITKKKLESERLSDEVFSNFFDWLFADTTPVEFYCYGSADLMFVKNNLTKYTRSVKPQAALSLIAANLIDFSEIVKSHFRLSRNPSLKKVMMYYFPNDTHECHSALSDAEMLRDIYVALMREGTVTGIPFPEYIDIPTFKKPEDFDRFVIVRGRSRQQDVVYDTIDAARDFLVRQANKEGNGIVPENAMKRLISAINNKRRYFGYDWSVRLKTA